MPTPVGDKLADAFAQHEVNLLRLEASERKKILAALKKLENQLVEKLSEAVGPGETFTQTRAKVLLKDVTETIRSNYAEIYRDHSESLVALGLYETETVAKIINTVVHVELLSVGVPQSVIESMVSEKTVLGVPLKSFWSRQAGTLRDNFITQMRASTYAGETVDKMIQRVRGTKANNFRDGIMNTSRNGAEVVVRTAGQSILNDARMELYQANEDVLNGVQAQVTLDDRTSDICIARSGEAWDMDGNPLEGTDTDEDFPGPPPWHPNCRSTLIPIVKSIGEILGDKSIDKAVKREVKKLPEATQSSMDGQVAKSLTYEDWLSSKPVDFQKEVLGQGRWELWQKDQISLRDLIDQRGRPLTLDQLRNIEH